MVRWERAPGSCGRAAKARSLGVPVPQHWGEEPPPPSKYQSPQDNARLHRSVLPTGGRVLSGVPVLAWTLL